MKSFTESSTLIKNINHDTRTTNEWSFLSTYQDLLYDVSFLKVVLQSRQNDEWVKWSNENLLGVYQAGMLWKQRNKIFDGLQKYSTGDRYLLFSTIFSRVGLYISCSLFILWSRLGFISPLLSFHSLTSIMKSALHARANVMLLITPPTWGSSLTSPKTSSL